MSRTSRGTRRGGRERTVISGSPTTGAGRTDPSKGWTKSMQLSKAWPLVTTRAVRGKRAQSRDKMERVTNIFSWSQYH